MPQLSALLAAEAISTRNVFFFGSDFVKMEQIYKLFPNVIQYKSAVLEEVFERELEIQDFKDFIRNHVRSI